MIRSKILLKFMKNYKYIFVSLISLILFFPLPTSAQENQPGEWIRAQSDNGELSVEFPVGYDFYADKDGFSVSSGSRSHFLSEMRMLNAYHEKTLLSLEAYKTDSPKDVAGIFAESDERNGEETEIKVGKSKFKQVLIKKENLYALRRFFTSENYLYILTAASRTGETPALKRFLDSLRFKTAKTQIEPAQTAEANVKTVLFSALKISQLVIDQNPEPLKKSGDTKMPPIAADIKDSLPLSIIVKPIPSYTEAARSAGASGAIRVRLTFSKNGSITNISFLSILKEGLARQAAFAAIRLKFIPAEKNGKAITSAKLVEYNFSIY
jgi:hypothetical protein